MIKETITFTFRDEVQQERFHHRLRTGEAQMQIDTVDVERWKIFVDQLRSVAHQDGDNMVISRDDWARAFEKLWG